MLPGAPGFWAPPGMPGAPPGMPPGLPPGMYGWDQPPQGPVARLVSEMKIINGAQGAVHALAIVPEVICKDLIALNASLVFGGCPT